jgi:hypothetical protein
MRRTKDWPWRDPDEPPAVAYLLGMLIHLVVATGLTVAATYSGQISGPFAAVGIGVAAPKVFEQLAEQVPLTRNPAPGSDGSGGENAR